MCFEDVLYRRVIFSRNCCDIQDIFHLPVFCAELSPKSRPYSHKRDSERNEASFPAQNLTRKNFKREIECIPAHKPQRHKKEAAKPPLFINSSRKISHLELILLNLGKFLVGLGNLACKVCLELLKLSKKLRIYRCKDLNCKDSCILCSVQRHGCNRNA